MMLAAEGDYSGIWVLVLGPAILGILALLGLLGLLFAIRRRQRQQLAAGFHIAGAVVLALVAFGIGSCYAAVLLG